MNSGPLISQLQTAMFLLMLVVAFAGLARRWSVPYPIVLVVAGLALSFLPGIPRIPLNPQLVFVIFLPPLLYAAAYLTSWRDFRHNLLNIAMLAFGLVGFTVWGVAYTSDHFITFLDWKSGLLFGAVVSTTDAIAATSIPKRLGMPRTITDLLEGESLLNDATGLVALEFALVFLLRDKHPSVIEGAARLAWLTFGGLGIGLALGVVVAWFERFLDDGPTEIVISMIVPYAAYLAAEAVHGSGILATVACGLYVGRQSPTIFSPPVRIQIVAVWRALIFVLNGLVFVLIGLQLPFVLSGIRGYGRWTLLLYATIFSCVLVLLRLAWNFSATWGAYWLRTSLFGKKERRPSARAVFVVGWTGMRGVIALAAAYSLPETLADGSRFPQRDLIIFLTFSVILVTLVFQGLTLPLLIRRLGLAGADDTHAEEVNARRVAVEAGLRALREKRTHANKADVHLLDDLIHRYEHRVKELRASRVEAGESPLELHEVWRIAAHSERAALLKMRNDGEISDDVMRVIERDIDLMESRYDRRE
jgi:CPA1 family monovalent cation:H+ antiporter